MALRKVFGVAVVDNIVEGEMAIVQPGNDAFVSLASGVLRNSKGQAVAVIKRGDQYSVRLVTFDRGQVIAQEEKGSCPRGEVFALISCFGVEQPLCLLHFQVKGHVNKFGWGVVDSRTLQVCGEREFYYGVI